MREFTIDRDYHGVGCKIYKKSKIIIKPGLTVLVGCNGSGKTTMIQQLKDKLHQAKVDYLSFDNLRDGGSHLVSKALFFNDMSLAAGALMSSEGEQIALSVGEWAKEIGQYIRRHTENKELWLFFDAVDSGLSVDNVLEVKDFFNLVFDDNRGKRDVYIVISANEYELAREAECFAVHEGEYITFRNYEEYRNYIIKSRKAKDSRKYRQKGD